MPHNKESQSEYIIKSIENAIKQNDVFIKNQLVTLFDTNEALQAVYDEGMDTFDSEEQFFHWMIIPHRTFDNQSPLNYLKEGRFKEVLQAIDRINYGNFA